MTVRVETAAYGAPSLEVLRAVVAEAKRDDPMAAVTVLAPNNIAAIVARRHLAAGGEGHPGIAGIEVITLARLSERLATPRLAPRRPATRAVLAAAWRRVLAEEPGRFRDIAQHPATVRALVAAYAELRDLSPGALNAVKGATPVGHDLVVLYDSVTRRLREDWYDATDLLTVAAAHIEHSGACVLYLPQDLTQVEVAFVAALGAQTQLTVIAGKTGVKRADAAVERTLSLLGVEWGTATAIATADRVINASDSDEEVRCVVRDVMATLKTTAAHRVAVLYSAATPYARLVHEQLGSAGVTVNGTGALAADERAVARTLLELLSLADRDVPRAELFRALANAPVRDFDGERIPVSRWERASRSAGVVAGEDWTLRLDAYLTDRAAQAEDERADVEPREWLIDRLGRDIETAVALRDFATRLRAELLRASRMRTWHELADWCLNLFTTLVGDEEALRVLPTAEQYAAATIISVLRGLAGLDAVDTSASLDVLRDALDAELAGALQRVGRFGEGVFVAPLSAAIGLDLDVVYLVGLSEDLYPGRVRADALLPDRVRGATNGELPSLREGVHAKQRHLLTAFACAQNSVVSFARGDLRRSSRRLPSRFLLPTLRELSGDKELAATAWDQPDTYAGSVFIAGSFAGELLRTTDLATEQEWRTREAAATRHLDDAVVRDAVAMLSARASADLSRYDGNLSEVSGLPDYANEDRAVSPTSLESYAQCPHGYFVERLLGVHPLEQPEDIVAIQAMDIGNLIHESVEALVTEFARELPQHGKPWTRAQHERLVEIAVEKGEEFRRRGLTGHPRLWERERERIARDIESLLDVDDRWRAMVDARVVASELPFGLKGRPPVEVRIPGGRVLMRGSADLVDEGSDGTLHVTDIKTGSRRQFKDITQDDPLVNGTKLQLPVYAYAAREQFGDRDTRVSASYWFVRREPGRIEVELTPEVEQAYARTLSIIVASIAGGLFPPKAPDKPDFAWVQCAYCNPDGVGHADNRERWERKRFDPILRELVSLIEPDALPGAGE
jgi:ATP-dependent helicase/nuclease subunit B